MSHKCEERHGTEAVERVLDAAHALKDHGVNRYAHRAKPNLAEERRRAEEWRAHAEATYNDLWRTVPGAGKDKEDPDAAEARLQEIKRELGLPEENLLYLIEKRAPRLEDWQRELVRIVRLISQYFYPQKQTQMMNEGCATFVHYEIMRRLHDKGLITEGSMLEFLHSHSSVVFQPDFDDPRFSGLNPYALGFAMMSDIQRICEEPTEEDREWFPDIAGAADAYGVLRHAWANYRDESFVLQYLSPAMIRQFRLFQVSDDSSKPALRVEAIHDDLGYRNIRSALSRQYDLSRREPDIQVVDVDLSGDRCLILAHYVHDGVLLEEKSCRSVLRHAAVLWGYSVKLLEIDAATDKTLKTYEVGAARLITGRGSRSGRSAPCRAECRHFLMIVLGIETSCDETAAAVVATTPSGPRIRANLIQSQLAEHAPYGGVVPEIAARAHLDHLDGLVVRALAEAGLTLAEIDGVAAAAGPGSDRRTDRRHDDGEGHRLGRRQAVSRGQPSRRPRADRPADRRGRISPICCCWSPAGIASSSSAPGSAAITRLGTTLDDAAGEAFDKSAKLIGLGYPGGPAIEHARARRRPAPFRPAAAAQRQAGLRFLVLRAEDGGASDRRRTRPSRSRATEPISRPRSNCAICDALVDRTANAIAWFRRHHPRGTQPGRGGRRRGQSPSARPPGRACGGCRAALSWRRRRRCAPITAAMIAWAGIERLRLGLVDGLDAPLRPRWPLDPAAPRRRGAGVKA